MGTYCLPWSEYTMSGYIESKTDLLDKINAISAIESAFLTNMLDLFSGTGATTQSYELDDGQVRIKTAFRSMNDVNAALKLLRVQKNVYINQYNGRCSVAQDKRTFI